ncbi:protein-methionine-sulfoxide reductase heme-binding subunit MsrQ [Jezberella montanilacus]|jgi:sulfoxide reductase heme-binding subunit YedZ|nr:protein-methionine-sulfoxide reductase heme-binding subunit MsrQ [Jezberella montanilacus]
MSLSAKQVGRLKPILFLLGLLPIVRWVWLGINDDLTANPVEFLTRSAGTWTLVCLLVTLSITPVRQVFQQPALVRLRRMCGLFAFFYCTLHMLAWSGWDQGFDLTDMLTDIAKRPFILVGMVAFLTMTALAITSNQFSMKRLGKRWQRLHQLVYLIGCLAILHYWWHKAGKHNFQEVSIYAGVLFLLLAWRFVRWGRQKFSPVPAVGNANKRAAVSASGNPDT